MCFEEIILSLDQDFIVVTQISFIVRRQLRCLLNYNLNRRRGINSQIAFISFYTSGAVRSLRATSESNITFHKPDRLFCIRRNICKGFCLAANKEGDSNQRATMELLCAMEKQYNEDYMRMSSSKKSDNFLKGLSRAEATKHVQKTEGQTFIPAAVIYTQAKICLQGTL